MNMQATASAAQASADSKATRSLITSGAAVTGGTVIARKRILHPEPVYEARRHYHPAATYEPRQKFHPTAKYEARQVFHYDPTEDAASADFKTSRTADQLPWPTPADDGASRHPSSSITERRAGIGGKGTMLDMFI